MQVTAQQLEQLPQFPEDEDGPVFAEPWQAKAFAMTLTLYEQGIFGWDEWARVLSEEIRNAQAAGDADLGDTYYEHWLVALERLVTEKGVANPAMLNQQKEQWRQAYLHTPHGEPVELHPESNTNGNNL
jgi:nitrile hydratase accessory protein